MLDQRSSPARRPDTGMTKPYRRAPADFRETYIRMGWDGITDHYRTNDRCIARWIEECDGDVLRWERSQVTGLPARPERRSTRYQATAGARAPVAKPGSWLKVSGSAYRLAITLTGLTALEERFGSVDRDGIARPKSCYAIFDGISGGFNEMEGCPLAGASALPRVPSATLAECVETVRSALVGGGIAVDSGEHIRVEASAAERLLQKHFIAQPLEHTRRLASVILARAILGEPRLSRHTGGPE